MSIAMEIVYNDFEDATPMTVATLLHAMHFFRALENVNQWTSHLSVAIRIAKTLGFHDDVNVYWSSPRRNILNQLNVCRGKY